MTEPEQELAVAQETEVSGVVRLDRDGRTELAHDPVGAITYTVISDSTDGAWPVVRLPLKQLSP